MRTPQPRTHGAQLPPLPERAAYLGAWTWRQPLPGESADAWLARTALLRIRLLADAAAWLRVDRAVLVHHDAQIAGGLAGRTGRVHRLCSRVFADHAVVRFEPVGRQQVARMQMLPLELLEPVGGEA